jgi:hypothetical protein
VESIRQHNRYLRRRMREFPEVRQWLELVENPIISSKSMNFIPMRYEGSEPDNASYHKWYKSYNRLRIWVQNQ